MKVRMSLIKEPTAVSGIWPDLSILIKGRQLPSMIIVWAPNWKAHFITHRQDLASLMMGPAASLPMLGPSKKLNVSTMVSKHKTPTREDVIYWGTIKVQFQIACHRRLSRFLMFHHQQIGIIFLDATIASNKVNGLVPPDSLGYNKVYQR